MNAPLADDLVSRLADVERSTEKWRFSGCVQMTTQEARALIACTKALADIRGNRNVAIPLSTIEKLDWLNEKVRHGQ